MHLSYTVTNERKITNTNKLMLNYELVAEGLGHSLLSVSQIKSKGGSLTFRHIKFAIKFVEMIVAVGYRTNKLYVVDFHIIPDDDQNLKLDLL